MGSETQADPAVAAELIARLKAKIEQELRAYPYPITACDVAFKLLAEQRELCRVALLGLAARDGLSLADAGEAIAALLATPLAVEPHEQHALQALARTISIGSAV
ncbi:MAG: hypothetical protein ACKVP7_10280 [Hyphomicrobiaceae bacterium]